MKQYIKAIFVVLVVGVFLLSNIHLVKAEDDEHEVEDYEDSREYRQTTETHAEDDEHEDSENDNGWDLSDDFDESQTTNQYNNQQTTTQDTPKEDVPVKIITIKEVVEVPVPIFYDDINYTDMNITDLANLENGTNITIPEIDLSGYDDYDGDGVINNNDQYPDEDDLLVLDSDNDGVVDRYDKYPGANDLNFEDNDHDGVIDSKDSNVRKMTDKDHDGIDDAYDTRDDRSFIMKALSVLGFVR